MPPKPPVVRIADAVDGEYVKVVGRVVACVDEPLVAPITGRACACYDAAIWSILYNVPDSGGGWTPILRSRNLRGTSFVIEDGSGHAVVDPRGAFVRLTHDHMQGERGRKEPFQLADPTFMDGIAIWDEMEIGEGVLAVGERVLVTGLVQSAAAGAAGLYRASADERIRLVGSSDRPLDVTDYRIELEEAGVVWPKTHVLGPGD